MLAAEYDGVTTQEWREYIGSSAMSYLYMFNRMDQKGSKASLCWVALLFAPAYFAYRKMWAWAAGTLALTTVSYTHLTEFITPYVSSCLYSLINTRVCRSLPTIYTSNIVTDRDVYKRQQHSSSTVTPNTCAIL